MVGLSLALWFAAGCGDGITGNGDGDLDIRVSNIAVLDYANNADASDIRVSFNTPAEADAVDGFRVIVVKNSAVAGFDLETALQLSADRYHELPRTTTGEDVELPSALLDAGGDAVVEGASYQVVVLSVAAQPDNQESQLSEFSSAFALERTSLVSTLATNIQGGSGGVALDADGNIYMADFGATLSFPDGDRVFKITPQGQVSVFATGFMGASGNDFDSQGNLFQSNIGGQSISKIAPDGSTSIFASGSPIVNTVGIYIDEADELYVADCDGGQILHVDAGGTVSVYVRSALFSCPNGITRDDDGNYYTSNFYNGDVLKITPEKDVSLLTTLPGDNNGHLTYHEGSLYVIARSVHRIYKVSLDGDAEIFAGSGQRGHRDGSVLQASFSFPNDLVFSDDGTRLYVNEVAPLTGATTMIAPCNIRVIEIIE
jgi:sugar lactone lactonase YvrE